MGHSVFECNRQTMDLTNPDAVKNVFDNNYFDLVIHTALVGREQLYQPLNGTESLEYMDDPIVKANVDLFKTLLEYRHRYGKLINFGSGNEFNTDEDIVHASENEIFSFDNMPRYSYGFAKNYISRTLLQYEDFYTLRLFGVFHYTESPWRFFKKLLNQKNKDFHIVEDRMFDFINLDDITPMIDIIAGGECRDRDINLVYQEKYTLSYMASEFNDITNTNANIIIDNPNGKSYTGDYSKFYNYNTPKMGLHLGYLRY